MKNVTPAADETVNYYYYLGMVKRVERLRAFEAAIQATVRPGDVVVEIGAGLGTYSFFAARCGAGQVYAIERERVIEVAQEIAARNGLADRVTFIRGDSTDVELPEKADVLIIEDFSSLFLRRGLEETVRDALARHLKPGGTVLPAGVTLHLAPVGDPELRRSVLTLEDESYRVCGLDLGVMRDMMLGSPHVRKVEPESLLATPQMFRRLALDQPEGYLFDAVVSVPITRTGTMDGIVAWFDLELTSTIGLSNAPSCSDSLWRQVFFPFPHPLEVVAGETIILRLSCTRSARTRDLWWRWEGSAAAGLTYSSSFQGIAFRPSQLDPQARPIA